MCVSFIKHPLCPLSVGGTRGKAFLFCCSGVLVWGAGETGSYYEAQAGSNSKIPLPLPLKHYTL